MNDQPPITITVRLYSILRQRDGRTVDRLELQLPPGSQVADALNWLGVPADLEVVLALNDQIAKETAVLHDRDRLSIIPAVAGGVGNLRR